MSNKEQEIWKVYPDYDFIEVSNLGRVRTKDRVVMGKDDKKYHIKGRILKQCDNGRGYMLVKFSVNNKTINLLVHRIVATCFIPNPHNYPEVNHKDNDRTNNVVSNLEWCTRQYNEAYKKNFGTSQAEVLGRVLGRSVIAVNLETLEVFWFKSQCEAERQLGIDDSSISKVSKEKQKRACGYWFCRADKNAVEKTKVKFGDKISCKVKELMNNNNN